MLHSFVVKGTAGISWYHAVSQEWAMLFYKVAHGEDSCIKACRWVQ
jgi:hypothetical protein